MTAHDAYLAGHRSHPVRIRCKCGNEWDGTSVTEYGTSWLEPRDDCLVCGSTELEVEELDELDIEERRLESRGENF